MLDNAAPPRASKYERVKMKDLEVTEDVVRYLLDCVADAAAPNDQSSSAKACIKLSLALGTVEEALTRKKDPTCLELEHVQTATQTGLEAIEKFTRGGLLELLQQKQSEGEGARPLVKVIITRLAGSLSSSMPSDAKHRQHLSCVAEWLQAGMKKKGLKMDCAGLTLAVFCLSQLLQDHFPALSTVRMAVAEDHCWISLDGSNDRNSAAEVATEKGQGEPPPEDAWSGWLYNAGHATVCTHRQVVAAILTSMDTCIGEKSTQDLDAARVLQQELLEALRSIHESAMYPNAVCVLAELQQDVVLDAAEEAGKLGGDVRKELGLLKPLYESMLRAGGLMVCESGKCPEASKRNGAVEVDSSLASSCPITSDMQITNSEPDGFPQEPECPNCPLTIGESPQLIEHRSRQDLVYSNICPQNVAESSSLPQTHYLWYPCWFACTFLTDTVEVLDEKLKLFLGTEEVESEVHALCCHALHVLSCGCLSIYRYSKNDGQLYKTLEQIMEGAVDYFVWAGKHKASPFVAQLCFKHFLSFVDNLVLYFTGSGVPSKLSQSIIKILKLHPIETRTVVCEKYVWRAPSMHGSTSMWINAVPALRAAIESSGAEQEVGGRRKRARVDV